MVVNNQAYAAVGAAIRRYAGDVTEAERKMTVELTGPRIVEVAEGFGVPSFRAHTMDELSAALDRADSLRGPRLVEVMTDPLDLGP